MTLARKMIVGVAAAGMVATALSGCSASDPGASDPGDAGAVTLWQHSNPTREPVVTELTGQLEEEADITVDAQFIPYEQYFDKLVTGLRSGTGPDVFQLPEEMSEQFIEAGLISPVPDDVATSESFDSTFLPAAVERWKKDGEYYGLPTDVQVGLLYANVDLLEQCGGDPGALPRTWDELLAQARECTVRDANGNIVQAGLETSDPWSLTTQAMYADSDALIFDAVSCSANLTSSDVESSWTTATEFIAGDTAVDSPELLPGQNKFFVGKAVFGVNMPWWIGALEQDYPDVDFVAAPAPTRDGQDSTFVRGWAYVVNADAKDQTAAWTVAAKLGDADAQRVWFEESGSLPALAQIPGDINVDENRTVALEALSYSKPIQNIGIKSTDALNEAYRAVGLGSPVSEALATAEEAVDGYIADALGCTK